MKKTVRVKLITTNQVADSLSRTLLLANRAADIVSIAHHRGGIGRKGAIGLQPAVYPALKAMGLSAQPSLLVISKVKGAYKALASNLKNGNHGPRGSTRRVKIEAKPVAFRPGAAQPYDDRCLSWQWEARTVSIWTVDGRTRNVPFLCKASDAHLLAAFRKGETDLVFERGNYYLFAVLDLPDVPEFIPRAFIGVDMGITNLATTSDQANWSGGAVTLKRKKNKKLRAQLQSKGTKSAKRLLKKRSGREARFTTDTNHVISKKIVSEAQRTGRGISLEELTGIRERVRLSKPQREALGNWAFAQLRTDIEYKAAELGIPVQVVDPAYSSQECHACSHTEKGNRPTQENFTCKRCGVMMNADHNAAINLANRGERQYWANPINRPDAA